MSICIGPDLDTTTVQACLKQLKDHCLYLHFDGVRYCFKKDPNVTLLVEQEAEAVSRDEDAVRGKIKEMLEARLAGHNVEVWPANSGAVPDKQPFFLVTYMPLEFAAKPSADRQAAAKDIFEHYGDKPRQFRNGLALAVPTSDQIEALRRAVRYMISIERVKSKAKQHNLTDEQRGQLREREATEKAAAESAFLKLYTKVWLPKLENSAIAIESVEVGGMPLQTTLIEKKEARVHQRVMELITQLKRRVFDILIPGKLVEFFKLGECTPAKLGVGTGEVVSGFYSFLGFTRLTSDTVIRKAIVRGVKECTFGYTSSGAPALGPDGKYQVTPARVRFDTVVAEDEIDLDSGFLMLPTAIPQPAPAPPPAGTEPGTTPSPDPTAGDTFGATPTPGAQSGGTPALQTQVELTFSADRNQLFTAWNAMANLADLAGKVTVTVKAEKADGLDKTKLQRRDGAAARGGLDSVGHAPAPRPGAGGLGLLLGGGGRGAGHGARAAHDRQGISGAHRPCRRIAGGIGADTLVIAPAGRLRCSHAHNQPTGAIDRRNEGGGRCLSLSSPLTIGLASRYAIRFVIKPVAGYRTHRRYTA
jgi:hypothetical protein